MNQLCDRYQESRDIWEDHNHRQEFEHELINRKTTWWLTAQTILFAAYGVTLRRDIADGGDEFRTIVASAGLAVAIVTLGGVSTVIRSKYLSWRSYAAFYRDSKVHRLPEPHYGKPLQWGVETRNTWLTLLPDVLLPLIFAGAWIFLLV